MDAVHRFLPIRSAVGDEVLIGVMNGAGREDRHRMAHFHQVFGKVCLPGQGIILRRNRIMVDQPDIHMLRISYDTGRPAVPISLLDGGRSAIIPPPIAFCIAIFGT